MFVRVEIPDHSGLYLAGEVSSFGDEADDLSAMVNSWWVENAGGDVVREEIKDEDTLATLLGVDTDFLADYAVEHMGDELAIDWFDRMMMRAEAYFEGDR